ncbi:hypothetical protein [Wolbachia endosymbiont of Aedes albopictus]|uniref:hypothetical protein n=1 Tax=Wolbachia endosymbiont of Aedes albopictus TaxID=167957 RepID=UPI002167F182|nr:hypothetical protein [Wolbachia endosymbiont of Aedes albopictus]UVW84039.1 hypothetical protein NHG98_00770 [Wolbachia endosymbiont of Aedes albopictus]
MPRHWDLAFIIWLKLSLLDPSVSYFHDIIIKQTSVTHWDDKKGACMIGELDLSYSDDPCKL